MSTKYVYLIRCSHRFEDNSSEDFDYVWRVYSSLRKAQDCLELWRQIYTDELLAAGYDVECDVSHYVDYRDDGYFSSLIFKNGCSIKVYRISREIFY